MVMTAHQSAAATAQCPSPNTAFNTAWAPRWLAGAKVRGGSRPPRLAACQGGNVWCRMSFVLTQKDGRPKSTVSSLHHVGQTCGPSWG